MTDRDRLPKYYKNDYRKENHSNFQDQRNRRKYKHHYKGDKKFYGSDRSYDTDDSYSRDRLWGYHRDFRNQRHKRRHRDYCENECEDGYISDYDDSSGDIYGKGNHRISYKNKGRNKDKYQNKNKTGTVMTAMIKLEIGLRRKITWVMMMIYFTQKWKEYTKFCKQWVKRKKLE